MQVPMKTHDDRLRWAVYFGGVNVMALPEPALRKLRDELAAFLGIVALRRPTRKEAAASPGVIGVSKRPQRDDLVAAKGFDVDVAVTKRPFAAELSRLELHLLQESARQLVEGAAAGNGTRGSVPIEAVVVDVVGDGSARTLRIGGSVQAGFLLSLALLLATEAGSRVKQCPECGRLFARVRRQIYCSSQCTDRATWRNIPDEQKQRYRQKQYEKQGWTLGARSAKAEAGSGKGKTR